MSDAFIQDIVSGIINAALAAVVGSEGEGQERDAPQVMVSDGTRTTNSTFRVVSYAHSPIDLSLPLWAGFCGQPG